MRPQPDAHTLTQICLGAITCGFSSVTPKRLDEGAGTGAVRRGQVGGLRLRFSPRRVPIRCSGVRWGGVKCPAASLESTCAPININSGRLQYSYSCAPDDSAALVLEYPSTTKMRSPGLLSCPTAERRRTTTDAEGWEAGASEANVWNSRPKERSGESLGFRSDCLLCTKHTHTHTHQTG